MSWFVHLACHLVANLLDGLHSKVLHRDPFGIFADPPPLRDLVDPERLPPLPAAGQTAALHNGLHLRTGHTPRVKRPLYIPQERQTLTSQRMGSGDWLLGACDGPGGELTLLAGSFSLRDEISLQLSSQERLSESSPLSLSAYWTIAHIHVNSNLPQVELLDLRTHQSMLLQQQIRLFLLFAVLDLHILQPEVTHTRKVNTRVSWNSIANLN